MPSTRDIKRRQKSVSNTKQVTKAMEMVAASKMRKSQLVALQSRPYAEKAIALLGHIKAGSPDLRNIFLDGNPESKKLLAVVVTSDKGLCGGLNSAVIRESSKLFLQYKNMGHETELLLVGVKSKANFERMGLKIHETFRGVGDYVTLEEIKPIAQFIQGKYKIGEFNKVVAIYTEFISTLKQKVVQRQILPIIEERGVNGQSSIVIGQEYIFEPSPKAVLENLIPFLIDIYVYHIILESNASEHSARMVAMKNASDSAENILDELTLTYNKARQAAITREITEITAGVEALK
ncbi:MAG: ATP synthase F1 subunit gamma [Candidatus Spechtbacterales bacterium]